jgi:hypothetical protein
MDNADNSMDNADGSHGLAPARMQAQPPPAAHPPVDVLGDDNSDTEPHAHDRNAPTAPPAHNGTYTLPTGHFGLGLRGPTMASPAPTCGNNVGQMAWSDIHRYHLVHPPDPAQVSEMLGGPPMSSHL